MKIPMRNRKTQAFTLVEFMITGGLSGVLVAAVCAIVLQSSVSFSALGNYADLERKSSAALDSMTRDIRSADHLISRQTNSLVFSVTTNVNLSFTWDPTKTTLVRTMTGQADKVLLSNCVYLCFSTYQRNMSNQVFGAFSNSTPATCKLVDVSWQCQRKLFNGLVNTESVQTSKVVIRNKH